jgi:ATP-dependent Lon protease
MVETRSQKRKYDSDEEEITSPITAVIKKRNYQPTEVDESEELLSQEDELSENDESFESDKLSETEEEENLEKKIFSQKFNQTQIKEIMKESIKTMVKRYAKKDKNFLQDEQSENNLDEYDEFNDLIESIYAGEFFERVPLEDKKKELLEELSLEEIKDLNEQLNIMQDKYKNSGPSVIDVLRMKIPIDEKQKLLEKVYHLVNSEVLSPEYNSNLKYLNTNINVDPCLVELEEKIKQKAVKEISYKHKILKSKMSFDNKVIAYQKLEVMETYEQSNSDDFIKYKNWMDTLLTVPFGEFINIPVNTNSDKEELQNYIKNVRKTLDKNLSFLEKPKDQIINIVSQMIRNPDCNINAIGLYGAKGTGKSSVASSIAEALGRPLRMISLGGESDSSTLTGHGFTYIGSQPGRFVEILRECKTMNPVILIDELDKVSETHQGKEIIGTLIHLTDSSTNNKYNSDRYYSGIEFDLSKVLFIFTYNDPNKVDKILADRLYKIKVDNYKYKEKLEITNKHLISTVLEKLNLDKEKIKFAEDAVQYLVESSREDEGMRNIKTKIKIILTRINILLLTNETDSVINLKYKSLYPYYSGKENILIPKEHIEILLDESISTETDGNFQKPPHGMYV